MKIEIIPEWRTSWTFSTVRTAGGLALLSFLQTDAALALLSELRTEALPLLQPLISPNVWNWIVFGLAVAIIVLRNIKLTVGKKEETPQ